MENENFNNLIITMRLREAFLVGACEGEGALPITAALMQADEKYPIPNPINEGGSTEWTPEIAEAMRIPEVEARGNFFPYESMERVTF